MLLRTGHRSVLVLLLLPSVSEHCGTPQRQAAARPQRQAKASGGRHSLLPPFPPVPPVWHAAGCRNRPDKRRRTLDRRGLGCATRPRTRVGLRVELLGGKRSQPAAYRCRPSWSRGPPVGRWRCIRRMRRRRVAQQLAAPPAWSPVRPVPFLDAESPSSDRIKQSARRAAQRDRGSR